MIGSAAMAAAATNCAHHPDRPGHALCMECRRVVCEECATDWQGINYCAPCLARKAAGGRSRADLARAGRPAPRVRRARGRPHPPHRLDGRPPRGPPLMSGGPSVADVLDDAGDLPTLVAAPWIGVLWLTALPLRLAQAEFASRLVALGSSASRYGDLVLALAALSTAALVLATAGRAVFARACLLAIRTGAPPGREALRRRPDAAPHPPLPGPGRGGALLRALPHRGPRAAHDRAVRARRRRRPPGRAARPRAPAEATAAPFARAGTLVGLQLVFAVAFVIASANVAMAFHAGLWLAGAVPGIDLAAWARRLSLASPRFLALVAGRGLPRRRAVLGGRARGALCTACARGRRARTCAPGSSGCARRRPREAAGPPPRPARGRAGRGAGGGAAPGLTLDEYRGALDAHGGGARARRLGGRAGARRGAPGRHGRRATGGFEVDPSLARRGGGGERHGAAARARLRVHQVLATLGDAGLRRRGARRRAARPPRARGGRAPAPGGGHDRRLARGAAPHAAGAAAAVARPRGGLALDRCGKLWDWLGARAPAAARERAAPPPGS